MFILDVVNECSGGLANIIVIMKRFMDILMILAPIILILFGIIQFVKMVNNPDDKKNWGKIKNMLNALVMVFIIPVLVNTVMNLLGENYTISACWNNASLSSTVGEESSYNDNTNNDNQSIVINPGDYDPATGTGPNHDSGNTSSTSNGVISVYTHSKTGIKFNIYDQSSSAWAGNYYSSGQDIKQNGCLNTSVAVVSSAYDKSITPVTVFKSSYRHSYPYNAINALTNNAFDCYSGSTKKQNIINFLNDGNIVVIKVYGSKKGGSSSFTSSQHYMALLDITDTQIFVGNAYSSSGHGRSAWFGIDEVLTSVDTADYCIPSDSLK